MSTGFLNRVVSNFADSFGSTLGKAAALALVGLVVAGIARLFGLFS